MLNLRSKKIRECVASLSNNIRAENMTYDSFIDIYAGEDNISNIYNINNTAIYGRRGSGKTHLLQALKEKVASEFSVKRIFPVYIDLRRIIPLVSSAQGQADAESILIFKYIIQQISYALADNIPHIFGINEFDPSTRMACDTRATEIEDVFKKIYLEFDGKKFRKPSAALQVSEEEIRSIGASANISRSPSISAKLDSHKKVSGTSLQDSYISILDITNEMERLINLLGLQRVMVLLDEWSEVNIDTQLYLAEIIKKSFSSIGFTVKIAAIPNRTNLGIKTDQKYFGLEDGGDIQAYPLDMRYIFEENKSQTRDFFNDLLFKHLSAIDKSSVECLLRDNRIGSEKLINLFFANVALNEILIACAGIPRDFMNLLINSYDKFIISSSTGAKRISVDNLRSAHTLWYETDKKEQVSKHEIERQLLREIVSEVIEKRQSIYFLIPEKHSKNKHIQNLIDFRVMHLRRNGYSHKDHSGASYNVYSIDYGCYNSQNITKKKLDKSTVSDMFTKSFREIRRISLEDDFFQKFLMDIGEAFSCPKCNKPIDTNHLAYKKQGLCNHCFEKIEASPLSQPNPSQDIDQQSAA